MIVLFEENYGFQYENREKINYYPDWPDCTNNTIDDNVTMVCTTIDCSLVDNFCSQCCTNRSFVNDTYRLPPGIYPVRCFPGQIYRLIICAS
jgi:hypothetical protein